MTEFFSFLKILVLCVAGLIALSVVLIVLVNYLPRSPLRDVLGAVTKRIGATAAIAMIAIPVQPVPGIDGLYDLASTAARAEACKAFPPGPAPLALEYIGAAGSAYAKADRAGPPTW